MKDIGWLQTEHSVHLYCCQFHIHLWIKSWDSQGGMTYPFWRQESTAWMSQVETTGNLTLKRSNISWASLRGHCKCSDSVFTPIPYNIPYTKRFVRSRCFSETSESGRPVHSAASRRKRSPVGLLRRRTREGSPEKWAINLTSICE